jgi:DNA-binding beta-propeller fold protein YncE
MDRRRFLLASASSAALLARDPRAFAARLGGTWLTLVTADLESHVAVFDGWRLAPIAQIRTGPGPRSIESAHDRVAVVAHSQHGVVTLLDADTRDVTSDRSRIRAELDRFATPRYTAVHPRHQIAYVTDSDAEAVVAIDLRAARILSRTSVRGPARHVSISRDGRTLWIVLGSAAARVAVLDTSDARRPRLVRTFAPPFLAHDVVFAAGSRKVWLTSGAERRLAILGADGKVRRIIEAGASPQHVAFAQNTAFVASGDDGTVRRHRLDGTLVREARVPVGSYNITFGWGLGVTPSLADGSVTSLGANGRSLSRRDVGRAAHDACIVFGP